MDNSQKMLRDLDYHLTRVGFTPDKLENGQLEGELQLLMGAGFGLAWHDNQYIIDYLLDEAKKALDPKEYKELVNSINNNTHFTNMDKKIHDYESKAFTVMKVNEAAANEDTISKSIETKLDLIAYGFQPDIVERIITKELYNYLRTSCDDEENIQGFVKELRDISKLQLMLDQARGVLRDFNSFSHEDNETKEYKQKKYNAFVASIELVEDVGGVIAAKECLAGHSHKIGLLMDNELTNVSIKGKSATYDLKHVYNAMECLFNHHVFLRVDRKELLLKAQKEIKNHLEKLGLSEKQFERTAVKVLIKGETKEYTYDIVSIDFMVKHFDEIQQIAH